MRDEEYFENLVSSSIDGALTETEKEKLAAHLKECDSCAALKRDLEAMRSLFSADPEIADIPENLHSDIMKRVKQDGHVKVVQPEKPVRRLPVFTMVAVAAVVVLAVLGGGIGQMFTMVGSSSGGSTASADAGGVDVIAGDDGDSDAGSYDAAAMPFSEEVTAETCEDADAATGGADVYAEDKAAPRETPKVEGAPSAQNSGSDENAPEPEPKMGRQFERMVELPENLKGKSVTHCYLARGSGELPDVNGELILSERGISYFVLEKDISPIEETLAAVEQAGFVVDAYEDVGLVIDSKAETWILIVQEE